METPSTTKLGSAIGQKRAYSAVDSDHPAPKEVPRTKVLLLHLNVLLSFHEATTRTLRAAISEVLPAADTPELTDEAILLAFSKSPALKEILKHLRIRDLTAEENSQLHECYPRVYAREGWPLIQLAPCAREFLSEAKQRDDISLEVISNNLGKATELLDKLGVSDLVEAVISTTTNTTTLPHGHETLIISRALYDLPSLPTKPPTIQTCWIKTTPTTPPTPTTTPTTPSTQNTQSTTTLQAEPEDSDPDGDTGVKPEEESNGVDLVVEGLEELGGKVFGLGWKREEDGIGKVEEDGIGKVEGVDVVEEEDSEDGENV